MAGREKNIEKQSVGSLFLINDVRWFNTREIIPRQKIIYIKGNAIQTALGETHPIMNDNSNVRLESQLKMFIRGKRHVLIKDLFSLILEKISGRNKTTENKTCKKTFDLNHSPWLFSSTQV